jgi:hypothetical protein
MVRTTEMLRIVAMAAILAITPAVWASGEDMAGEAPAQPEAAEPAGAATTPSAGEPDATGEAKATAADSEASDPAVAEEPAAAPPAAKGGPRVALARFTTAVENREPVDTVTFLENDAPRIFFYTDLRNLSGTTVTHRWQLAGEVMAEVPFEVGSDRWRVWSSKRLKSEWTGDWTVAVVQGDDEVLASETFTLQPKPQP